MDDLVPEEPFREEGLIMQFYLAPMEEITGYVFRNVYQELFGGIDKYFTPFLSPTQKKILRTREKKEVAPENNQNLYVAPQILTNRTDYFLDTVRYLEGLGYQEFNLNLGCPSATVVTKGKGSGFLQDPDALDLFFREIFSDASLCGRVSVKSRLGLRHPDEFEEILEVYNRHPLKELILHPRVQKDYYKNQPDLQAFGKVLENSRHPVCYNGDIVSAGDYESLCRRFPSVQRLMIGRGVAANPGLIRQLRTGRKMSLSELEAFEVRLYEGYCQAYGDKNNAVYKLKEVWSYLGAGFPDSQKQLKKIKKAASPEKYREAVTQFFQSQNSNEA